ncbi:MAG: acyl-CoA desaturase [Ekhidna sp.]|nr:acyl-CoA desaturase [Ekhidna sp.]MBC6409553.1 acyl-CoA desaturase [Ekhidna sp.]MBC6425719.1 acyl-CoA desaturase [Ekhidna sp.]
MSALVVNKKILRFKNDLHEEFNKTLNSRVNEYLKNNKAGRYANLEMVIKTIFMFVLYLCPYFMFLFGIVQSVWLFYLMAFLMGLGKAGIGLSVMHDANHGAYSRKKWINTLIGYSLNLLGGNATNWKIQHNVKHHTYTNVAGMDEDISPKGGILRFNPYSDVKKYHKWQYIYAWFLYGLMTMSWIIVKDITQFIDYTKEGWLKKQTKSVTRAWIWLILTKILYYSYILALPLLFTSLPWYHIVLGFVLMHYVAGFTLGIIFQPAHVMEENAFEDSQESDTIEENWAVHQLKTTCNFAQKNKVLSWYVGGLNYQIEHHLFPNVCHVHYRKIAKIVRETAEEFNIPYKSYPTFTSALISHGKMLYALGR